MFIGVSPSGKAQDFDSCIRWFESSYPSYELGTPLYDADHAEPLIGVSFNGRTADSDSVDRGSNPFTPADWLETNLNRNW